MQVTLMTDAQREEAIQRAGKEIEQQMATWQTEGCMAARGAADRARVLMGALIAGRSDEQIRRMEAERGLA